MVKPPLSRRIACRRTCQTPTMMTSWASLETMKCTQGSKACGFASELEEWSFYLEMTKHCEEVNEDVASHIASHPKWTSRAKLSWRRTRTGRRRARGVGSGVTQSSLHTVEEEKACPVFLKRISDAALDDLQRHRLDARIIFTSTLRL
eukprot:5806566-Amphidinium_carterae.1